MDAEGTCLVVSPCNNCRTNKVSRSYIVAQTPERASKSYLSVCRGNSS